ncbi:recombinase family protein, partial [Nocardia acidivorans]|uniref:recombinase family protein n=1 Tax=Nocardia acidivorans TaxID=404580 RepID=UPI000AC58232
RKVFLEGTFGRVSDGIQKSRARRLEIAGQLRAVIYARVSKPGEKSVRDQEKVGRRDLAEIGVVVVAVFSDKMSASRYRRVDERPGFLQTKDFIRAGKADLLWTFAANRAHRDLDDYVPLRRLCIETGTLWRYGKRTLDLSKSADRRVANADAMRSEEQADDISDAVNRGIQEGLEEGKPHGRVPRGYRIIRDANSGKPIRREPIPEQARVIQEATRRLLAGESLRSVSTLLEPKWRAAGGTGVWTQTTVRALLLRPTYVGHRTYYGQSLQKGTWEGIITLEQHEALRALLTDPSRTKHKGTAPVHLVTWIALCGVCKQGMTAKGGRGNPGRVPTVRCRDGHVSRSLELVEAHVEELLLQLLEDPDTARKLHTKDESDQAEIDADLALIKALEGEIETYVKDAAKTKMSAAAVAVYVEEKEREIRDAQARLDATVEEADPVLSAIVGPDARQKWKRADIHQKRDVLRAAMRVTIEPLGKGFWRDTIGVSCVPVKSLAG